MKIKLLGRADKEDKFRREGVYSTYGAAVRAGQQLFGERNFTIDTGTYIPTREEQLLLSVKNETRKNILATL